METTHNFPDKRVPTLDSWYDQSRMGTEYHIWIPDVVRVAAKLDPFDLCITVVGSTGKTLVGAAMT